MRLAARAAGRSDVGLHRQTNEDSWVALEVLFAVADGMGGARAGEVASRVAIDTLVAHLPRLMQADEAAAGHELAAAADDANLRIYELSREHVSQAGMGTTLTAVLLTCSGARLAHIGDSRAYVLRDRLLEQITDDHSLVAEMTRSGELSADEAVGHPLRSVLSRALGTEPDAQIDLLEVDLQAGDTLLLCSDGLSGVVPHDKLTELVGEADPAKAADKLVKAALKRGAPDNVTAVVVKLDHVEDDEAETVVVTADEQPTMVRPADPGRDWADALEDVGAQPGDTSPATAATGGSGGNEGGGDGDGSPVHEAGECDAAAAGGDDSEAPAGEDGDASCDDHSAQNDRSELAEDEDSGERRGWWRSLWGARGN